MNQIPTLDDEHLRERNQLVVALRQQILENIRPSLAQRAYANVDDETNAYRHPRKAVIRSLHRDQRLRAIAGIRQALNPAKIRQLLSSFALGVDVDPERIEPELVMVKSDSVESQLFRLATATWSIPPTAGYGRRMRWLVIDRHNEKLIGVCALCDPVIALSMRDEWIGWSTEQRHKRLSAVMSAYVIGSIPPYSQLLGGKLVTALISSREVSTAFKWRYSGRESEYGKALHGSGKRSDGILALVMITSAFGRSSIYNRVHLPGLLKLYQVGATTGWGHFQVGEDSFREMRRLLELEGHDYAKGNRYGQGANWKMRVIREALSILQLDQGLLRHRVYREVFGMPMGGNWRDFLLGKAKRLTGSLPTVDAIAQAAKERWILLRAARRSSYRYWDKDDLEELFAPILE